MTEKTMNGLKHENKLLREQIKIAQNQFEVKVAELSMMGEIGRVLLYVNSFELSCRFILDVIINNTVAQNCSIMLLDKDRDKLFLVGANDPGGKRFVLEASKVFSKEGVSYGFKAGEGAAGKAVREKRHVLIHDTEKSPDFDSVHKSKINIGSLLSVPLIVEGESFGVINLSHSESDVFSTDDVNLFNIIANFIAISIHSTLNYEKLQYSEEKYRALSENSNNGIAVILEGAHIYANPKYQSITGYSFEELEKIPFETLMDSTRNETCRAPIRSLLKGKYKNKNFEIWMSCQSGTEVEAAVTFSPITYNGKPASIISVWELTEQRELEKQLQQAEKMEAIGTLAGGVAHDLNNILGAIVGYPDLILDDIAEDSPMRSSIVAIKQSGERAAAIVQDLLTLARRGVQVTEVVNLNTVVKKFIETREYEKLKEFHSNVEIETVLEKELLNIKGSPIHLSKTVMNLVSNAAEAMPEGGKIMISSKNMYLDRTIKGYDSIKEGDYVVLSVADNGIGIDKEALGKIFEPFYTKKVMGRSGTGLGMTVVWGTVKDHGGYIDIKSAEGQGTTFTLYFPVTREIESKKKYVSIEEYSGNGEKILVVDDVAAQRGIAVTLLNKLNYNVEAVESGEAAVEHMKNHSADLLVLDMIMDPGIDGLETYKRIKSINSDQKAIITSGFTETDSVKEARKLGAGGYVKKPYTLEKIGRAVKNELENK